MAIQERGVSCTGKSEGGDSDAVYQIMAGGCLSNVIIGPNQIEGVHCQGVCTLTKVWWSAVCKNAFSIKKQESGATTCIEGGGTFGADDKIVQHNGAGTVSISEFLVEDFGKLHRRSELAGINANYGNTATFNDITASDVDDICVKYKGTDDNDEEQSEIGVGEDGTYCRYKSNVVSS